MIRTLYFTLLTAGWLGAQVFIPIADTDSQSDTAAGTHPSLNVSRWCTPFIKFDLADGPDSIGLARLRLCFPSGLAACTLFVSATSNDTWVEGGGRPSVGASITSQAFAAASADYLEIDLTNHVRSEMAGNKIVSVALSSSLNGWTPINSREAATNRPELSIAGSGGNPYAVTGVSLSPARVFVRTGRSIRLIASVEPENAQDTVVFWSSSDSGVARVDAEGNVLGLEAGSAIVTAATRDGAKTASCEVSVQEAPAAGAMSGGCNFWNIGWENTSHFFKSGVDWSAETDPWNPVLITEIQQAGMGCLRFMDWNVVNYSCVKDWNQRIPKTVNHYNSANTVPCFTDDYDDSTNTHTLIWNGQTHYGVAVEWQIDLCNRTGADLWMNIPATATPDFEHELALLIHDQLDTNLKVYVEWANEVWNWMFAGTVYARDMADSLGLDTLNYGGAYVVPWRAYTVYASVRAFKQFEDVFGKNSPRLVKVIAGQVAYHWNGYDYNHMVRGDLAALANRAINPDSVDIDAYAMAPYMGGATMAAQRASLESDAQYMAWAKNSLEGTSVKLICYEAGSDNYPDQSLALTRDPGQEQLNYDYLAMLDDYCQGPVNQYCMYGGCWGLKNYPGEAEADAPKWRGWMAYWGGWTTGAEPGHAPVRAAALPGAGRLSPNPALTVLRISLGRGEDALLTLTDISGRMVMKSRVSDGRDRVNIQALPPGVYIVKIKSGKTISSGKLMVLR